MSPGDILESICFHDFLYFLFPSLNWLDIFNGMIVNNMLFYFRVWGLGSGVAKPNPALKSQDQRQVKNHFC